jgi:hypothetical protein
MRCDDWRREPNTPPSVHGALPIDGEDSARCAAPRTRYIAYAVVRRGRVIRPGDTRAVLCVSRVWRRGYARWDCSECRLVKQSHLSRYSRSSVIWVVAPHMAPSIAGKIAFLLPLPCSIPHAEVSNHTSLCVASGRGDRPDLPVWRHRHTRCRRDRTIHLRGIGVMVVIDARDSKLQRMESRVATGENARFCRQLMDPCGGDNPK